MRIWHLPGLNQDYTTLCGREHTAHSYYAVDHVREGDTYCKNCLNRIATARSFIRETQGERAANLYDPLWKHHNVYKLSQRRGG